MQIDKDQIIAWLASHGDKDKADQAQAELPDRVDTDQHTGLLDKIGINVDDLPLPASGVADGIIGKLGL